MRKNNFLHLAIGIAFIVLSFLSFFQSIDSKIIFWFSIASFLFAIIELLSAFDEGSRRMKNFKDDLTDIMPSELLDMIKEESQITIDGLEMTKKQAINAKDDLINRILTDSFDIEKVQRKSISKPSQTILDTHKKQSSFDLNIMSEILSAIEVIKPQDKSSFIEWFNLILSIFSIILLFSSPFMPNEVFMLLHIDNIISEVGTSLTLLSLALIFFTSFIRNFYYDKAKKLQHDYYNKVKDFYNKFTNIMEKRELEINHNGDEIKRTMNDLGKLMGTAIEKEFAKMLAQEGKSDKEA
jgi:hypothetical protein